MTDLDARQLRGFRTREAKFRRQVLSDLVESLPKCTCGVVATKKKTRGIGRYLCDQCCAKPGPKSARRIGAELPWGKPARRAYEVMFVLSRAE